MIRNLLIDDNGCNFVFQPVIPCFFPSSNQRSLDSQLPCHSKLTIRHGISHSLLHPPFILFTKLFNLLGDFHIDIYRYDNFLLQNFTRSIKSDIHHTGILTIQVIFKSIPRHFQFIFIETNLIAVLLH